MDDQRKYHIDPKGPKQRNSSKQLQIHKLPTDDVENINSTKREVIYYSLTSRRIIPWGTEGCRTGSRGTAELLYIDQHILNESKTRRKDLAMAWIDYKKAYDMVPQSWIINCFKMYKISYEVINFIEKIMKTWRVELTPLLLIIAMIPLNHIHRKCTTGYKLSRSQEKINHLMYIDDIKLFAKNVKELETLIHAVRIYYQDIGMEFGREKCAMLVMKSGKRHLTDGIELPNQDKISTFEIRKPTNTWASWSLTPSNKWKWKKKIQKENQKATRDKIVKQKPYQISKYLGSTLVRYSGPFLKWNRKELKQMDKITRKLMIIPKVLHPRDDVDRLYVPRKEGGRGLASIEDNVDASIKWLEDYIEKHRGLITAIKNETDNTMDNRMTITR